MSYFSVESSTHSGAPVHLLEFVQGAQTLRYTTRGEDISVFGHTWQATPIEIGNLEQTNELNKHTLALKFPRDHAFAASFVGYAQEAVTSLTIWRGHPADGEFIAYWKGRVSASSASGNSITLDCEDIFTSLRRPGLRARYQTGCRHMLYGRGCNVDKANYDTTLVTLSLDGLSMTAPITQPDGWYTGGMAEAPDGSVRFILKHVGQTLTLIRPFEPLAALVAQAGWGQNFGNYWGGIPVILYPGCDRLKETCSSKFNNLPNFGGFPYIPGRNPLDGRSIV